MTDSTAHMVKKQATTIMMAPTALLVLMMENEAIQPLFPHLGMPTDWMTNNTTWQKNTKKNKKKLKELSVLKAL